MKYIIFTIIILVFAKNKLKAYEHKNAVMDKASVNCVPKTTLQRCNKNFENTTQWIWRRDKQYLIGTITKQGCSSSFLSYSWTIKSEKGKEEMRNKPKDKSDFILDYYELDTGLYVLEVTVTETFQKSKQTTTDKCLINIRAEMPIPVILGGNVRVVSSGVDFLVDGKYSINLDVKPDLSATLNYKWSCVCHTDPYNTFCRPTEISYANEVEFPSARDGEKFTVYLSVSTDYSPWIKTEQDINVMNGGHNIIIDCLKNCRVFINYKSQIYLEAFCENCLTQDFTWTMEPGKDNLKTEMNFQTETVFGKNKPKLLIKKGVLVPGDEYKFYCYYTDKKSYAYETLKIDKLPKMSADCQVNPKVGQSLVTLFTITCDGVSHTQPVSFSLYQVSNTDILLATNFIGRLDVYLPAATETSAKLYVKITDPDNLYIIKNLTVQITSFLSQVPESDKMTALIQKYDEIIPQALQTGNTENIIQLMNVLASEAKSIATDNELKQELKMKILQDLEKLPLKTQNDIAQTSSLNKNVWYIPTEHDRKFSKTSASRSQKIAKEQLRILNEVPFPDRLDLDVNDVVPDLLWVANQNLETFLSETIVQDVTFMVTTPAEMLTFPVVPEYYVDYKDADLDYVSRIRDYKDATKTAIEIMTLTGLAVAKTLIPGEPNLNLTDQPNVLQVFTGGPNAQTSTKLGDSDARVIGSPSLTDIQDVIHGVVTVYSENPYWWHKNDIDISTKILNANYFHNDKLIINTKEPLQLLFTANWTNPIRSQGIITIPSNVNKTDLEKYINVHRVDVKQGGALIVDFYDVKDGLDVVVTYNRRPRGADFNSSYVPVSRENATHIFFFPDDLIDFGNSWLYVGVLPRKKTTQDRSEANLTTTYELSFVTTICSYWSNAFEKWISSDCQTGHLSNKQRVQCFCTHHSSYVGSYFNAPNKVIPYTEINLALKTCMSWMVFIVVSVVCLTYCIFMAFAVSEPLHNNQKALFLTDNVENDNYYYLVVVKTGSQSFSGTTSNIGLQICGSIADSRPHLLNFPDPYMKLLQRTNEDRFVLASSEHLGRLNYIWLWFDSVGRRPSWYCERITIVDLQNEDKWHFGVNKLFSVLEGGYCKAAIEPSPKEKRKDWRSVFDEHIWNITTLRKGRLSYVKRLTIILSTILTSASITLILYGVPNFRKSGGLGYGHYQPLSVVFLVSFLSSVASFFVNLIFVESFSANVLKWKHKTTWAFLIILIIVNFTFLVAFGFWISHINSLLWLTSTIGALVLSVVVFETLYIALTKNDVQDDVYVNFQEVLAQTNKQKLMLIENFGSDLLRSLFINKYRSLTVEEWKIKREKELLRRRLAILVQDLIMFIVYVVLLFFIVLANRDSLIVFSNKEITDLVVADELIEISSLDDLYQYLNVTLIEAVHSMNWYGTWNTLQPGLLSDFSSKILGVARIRQQRVCKNCCTIPELFRNFTFSCKPEYTSSNSVQDEFMEFWKPLEYIAVPRLANAWKYTYGAMDTFGYFKLYPAGGYSADLGRTMYNSYYNLQYYLDTVWIDGGTRALFIEFLSYNVDYNIFHVVTLIIEKSATGLFHTTYNVISTRLLFVKHDLAVMITIEVTVFVIIVITMLVKNICFAKTQWKDYLKDTWNFVDVFITIMSFLSMGIYWYRVYSVGKFLDDLQKANHNHFLDYFNLIRVEYLLTVMAALLICVATARLWKLLRFIPDFKVFEQTIVRSRKLLLGLAVCHWLIWCMYSVLGAVFFGSQLSYFHNTHCTLTTLMLLSMNLYSAFNFDDFVHVGGGYAYFYFVSYAIVMLTIYSVYVSLLMIYYSECNGELSNSNEYYSFREYVTDELKYYKESFWPKFCRLRAGEDSTVTKQKLTPKSDERRYADSITLSAEQILAMLIVTKTVLDNLSAQKDSNLTQTIATFIYYLGKAKEKSEHESRLIGYLVPDDDDVYKIMFDEKLLDMEHIVRQILEKGVEENSNYKAFETASQIEVYRDRVVEGDATKPLDHVLQALKLISNVIDNIKVTCDRPCKRCEKNLNCYHLYVQNNFFNKY